MGREVWARAGGGQARRVYEEDPDTQAAHRHRLARPLAALGLAKPVG